jgi:uncharacterized protein (DUF1684 family)
VRFFLPLVLVGLTAMAGCNPPPPDTRDYATRIAAMRAAKDTQFQRDAAPVPESRKALLLPLDYFAIDGAYNVPAVLKPATDNVIVMMPTSSGEQRRERRAGTLEFTLKGTPMTLAAFVEADAPNMDHLFVPFRDLTAGVETYEAGRYLELDRTATGYYELDFNRAFNPYCYYSLEYECPFPPAENRLQVRIEAGEKIRRTADAK